MFAFLLAASITASSTAALAECSLSPAEDVVAARIVDGATFVAADGRRVRLALLLPKDDQPRANEAARTLSTLVLNKRVTLAYDERSVDRHGDVVAYVFVGADKIWAQARLVEQGFARVQTLPDIRACAAQLLEREQIERDAKVGIWSEATNGVRTPEGLAGAIGTFQIVEGEPKNIITRRDRTYVNFGDDYRSDFTLTISKRDMKRFAAAGVDPQSWKNKKIRVRGWLSLLNGPEIELTHPEQVEMVK